MPREHANYYTSAARQAGASVINGEVDYYHNVYWNFFPIKCQGFCFSKGQGFFLAEMSQLFVVLGRGLKGRPFLDRLKDMKG